MLILFHSRLDYFLIFFQHYYWFKKSHPCFTNLETNIDVFPILIDHMYKECLNNLRPKLKLIKSYEKAQEEIENLRQQLYPNLNDSGAGGDAGKLNTINEQESEDMLTEEYTSEALVDSDDQCVKPRSENEEFQDSSDENDSSDNPLMEELVLPEKNEPEKTEEDLIFEAMYEKMSTDSYQERIKESSKVNAKDIPVPMTSRGGKKTYDQLQDPESKQTDAVPFVLMVRSSKSGKQQFKNFVAPSDSQLAVNLKLQELKIKEEHEKVKRLTLNITERLEEEDYQESLQNKPTPAINRARTQKPPKFKHQKGAPDADLIFN